MKYPSRLKYTREHEWIHFDDDIVTIGITEYALEQLGDIVFIELPKAGESFDRDSTVGTIESTKTVADIFIPVGGKILEVNEEIIDEPQKINEDPYDSGWLLKVATNEDDSELLSAAEYEKYVQDE